MPLSIFSYSVTATHHTFPNGYIDSYLTKTGVDFTLPLTWEDFEDQPFCHYVPPSLNTPIQEGGDTDHFECQIPEASVGLHVILQVWQRSDSPEAFYSCADVDLRST